MKRLLNRLLMIALVGAAGLAAGDEVMSLNDDPVAIIAAIAVTVGVFSFLGTLVALQLDRASGALALAIIAKASKLLPAHARDQQHLEWADHVRAAGEHGLSPLSRALSIAAIAAPLLGIALRVTRQGSSTS